MVRFGLSRERISIRARVQYCSLSSSKLRILLPRALDGGRVWSTRQSSVFMFSRARGLVSRGPLASPAEHRLSSVYSYPVSLSSSASSPTNVRARMPPVRNVRSSQSKRIGLATASGGQQEVQHQATTPRWTQSAALSHNIGDAPIPPYLVWAAQNRLVPPLALLTEDALEALATDSALWTTHYEFDDLEGRDAPRRRCSNANCFDAWLPWTWADEALQFETFMSAFAKLVLLVRETLCTDAGARAAVQADTDQFIRQVSMRLRRPGNWRFIRRPVIDAVGTWRQQISQGVPWHENLLAQIGSDQIDEGLRCVTMHGREWPLSDHKPHGDTWPEIVESVLGFWRDKCECRQEGTRSATSIPVSDSLGLRPRRDEADCRSLCCR